MQDNRTLPPVGFNFSSKYFQPETLFIFQTMKWEQLKLMDTQTHTVKSLNPTPLNIDLFVSLKTAPLTQPLKEGPKSWITVFLPVPGDLWERLQASSDLVSVRWGASGWSFLWLLKTRVGADVSAAGMCLLAGRPLGTGEFPPWTSFSPPCPFHRSFHTFKEHFEVNYWGRTVKTTRTYRFSEHTCVIVCERVVHYHEGENTLFQHHLQVLK